MALMILQFIDQSMGKATVRHSRFASGGHLIEIYFGDNRLSETHLRISYRWLLSPLSS